MMRMKMTMITVMTVKKCMCNVSHVFINISMIRAASYQQHILVHFILQSEHNFFVF